MLNKHMLVIVVLFSTAYTTCMKHSYSKRLPRPLVLKDVSAVKNSLKIITLSEQTHPQSKKRKRAHNDISKRESKRLKKQYTIADDFELSTEIKKSPKKTRNLKYAIVHNSPQKKQAPLVVSLLTPKAITESNIALSMSESLSGEQQEHITRQRTHYGNSTQSYNDYLKTQTARIRIRPVIGSKDWNPAFFAYNQTSGDAVAQQQEKENVNTFHKQQELKAKKLARKGSNVLGQRNKENKQRNKALAIQMAQERATSAQQRPGTPIPKRFK